VKKMLVALGVAVVLAGLAAAPAGAAKGSSHPSVQYVEGSYSGTGSSTVLCDGWRHAGGRRRSRRRIGSCL
jgi:hypothetical protein